MIWTQANIGLSVSVVLWALSVLLLVLSLQRLLALVRQSSQVSVGPTRTKYRYYFRGRRNSDKGKTLSKLRYTNAKPGLICLPATPEAAEIQTRNEHQASG